MKKSLQLIAVFFMMLTLAFMSPCYAKGSGESPGFGNTLAVAIGAGIAGIGVALLAILSSNNGQSQTTAASAVLNASNMVPGASEPLTVKITYNGGTSKIITLTPGTSISSSDPSVVAIKVVPTNKPPVSGIAAAASQSGTTDTNILVAEAKKPGTATLTITIDGISTSTTVTVSNVVFGNSQGLVYIANQPLPGKSPIITLDTGSVNSVTTDIDDNIYAGTGEGNVWKYDTSSVNTNNTWVKLGMTTASGGAPLDGSAVNSVVVDGRKNVYAGTTNGNVWKYTSRANTWSQLSGSGTGGTLDGSAVTSILIVGSSIYAGTSNGSVWKYNKDSNSWDQLPGYGNRGTIDDKTAVNSIATDTNNNIYAGTAGGSVRKYINGEWEVLVDRFTSSVKSVSSVAVGDDGTVYAAVGNIVYKGSPDSSSWDKIAVLENTINSIAVDDSGNIYIGDNGGKVTLVKIAYSSFYIKTITMSDNPVKSVTVCNNATVYVGTGALGGNNGGLVYSANTNIVNWNTVGSNAVDGTSVSAVETDNDGNCYVGTYSKAVYKWNYNNKEWEQMGGTLDGTVVAIAMYYTKDIIYAGTSNGSVYQYNSANTSWDFLGNQAALSGGVSSLMVDNNGIIYAGTIETGANGNGNVYKYDSGSKSWNPLSTGLDGTTVYSLEIDYDGNIYAGTKQGNVSILNLSSSSSWGLLGNLLSNGGSAVYSLAVDHNNYIYAVTTNGFVWQWQSSSSSPSWIKLGDKQVDGSIVNVAVVDSNNNLFVGTNYGNVFGYNVSSTVWLNQLYGNGSSVTDMTNDAKE